MSGGMRLAELRLAPDGKPRPDAPFGRGPLAARVLRGALRVASAGGAALPARVAAQCSGCARRSAVHRIAWAVAGLRRDAGLGILYDSYPVTKAVSLLRNGEAVPCTR